MQSGKSTQKSLAKNFTQKLEKKTILNQTISPTSKKVSRVIISAGEHPYYIKKNSVKSKDSKEQIKQKQTDKEDKKQSRQSKSKKISQTKATNQKLLLNTFNQQVAQRMTSIPLFISFNENQQIEESKMMEFKNENASCLSQFSVTNIACLQQNWQVGERVGVGATSQVFKAFDKFTGRIAAVKKMGMTQSIKNTQLSILTQLKHPNIVEYYGFTKGKVQISIYMQFIPMTLQSIYKNFGGTIPYQNIRKYTKQILSAVNYIHNKKIMHKDIKCSNILLNEKGIIKLSDFGSSKQFDQSTSAAAYMMDGAITFRGSVLWMAPQVIVEQKFSRKSDIWSVGCTCLEMATGKQPWAQKNFENQFAAILSIGGSQQIPFIPPQLPQDLKQFIELCLVRDPQIRKTAQQLLNTPFIINK